MPRIENAIAVANGADRVRLDVFRVGRDRGKGARHLEQGDFACAERQAGHGRQLRLHAELARRVDDGLDPDGVGKLNRHRVDRVRKGGTQRHDTTKAAAVVLRLPIADLHRPIDRGRLRVEAFVEGGEIDEHLEQRAGLPLGLGRPVELAFVVVAASDHRENGAVRRQRDEGGLPDLFGTSFRLEPTRNDAFGNVLQIEIEGGAHGHIRGRRADETLHVATEHIHEIIRSRRIVGRHPQRGGLSARGIGLLSGNRAGLDHRIEHQRRPLPCSFEMAGGGKRGRRAHEAREHRRFAER